MELTHGGDWAGYESEYGNLPLDFSANVSPLGLPEGARRAAEEALRTADRYPDPACRKLRAALAAYHGVDAERIVCGNGAADLIFRLCRTLKPKKAALFVPCFYEYERALREEGCAVVPIALSENSGFRLPADAAASIPADCELLFLGSPNNPTGLTAGREALQGILARCRSGGMRLILDECFSEFTERPEENSLVGELEQTPELVILRAFTKTWAMAGLRLGCALCGDRTLAEALARCGQPWAVSGPAQAAGIAALEERAYLQELRTLITGERRRLRTSLAALGLRVIPGEANFLLFQSRETALASKLRARGILIRDCGNFAGLETGWFRCAVRTAEENDALLCALREVLADG